MVSSEGSMPFIKNLASSNRKIRTEALDALRAFLSRTRTTQRSLSAVEHLKLWKGLFYALWMADRALPQQNLCNELAALVTVLPRQDVVPWLRAFWATMAREWTGIDVLRMEKFLLLVRRVLGASFGWMKSTGEEDAETKWDAERVEDVLELLRAWPFSLDDEEDEGRRRGRKDEADDGDDAADNSDLFPKTVPAGMRIHVLDIWVDEAEKVGMLADDDVQGREILVRINGLVEALNKGTPATSVKVRSRDALADERLPWNGGGANGIEAEADDDEDMADDGSWDGFND